MGKISKTLAIFLFRGAFFLPSIDRRRLIIEVFRSIQSVKRSQLMLETVFACVHIYTADQGKGEREGDMPCKDRIWLAFFMNLFDVFPKFMYTLKNYNLLLLFFLRFALAKKNVFLLDEQVKFFCREHIFESFFAPFFLSFIVVFCAKSSRTIY